ncbi:alpha/beta fold hydrolase [Niveispirillum sp. KHB5.9]|uniref:alpha/beta fold hydrolase n=1 Tax=Niveispirillum sp. KHB5.9 TaxID=3400269 RepID=UPI003A83D3D5
MRSFRTIHLPGDGLRLVADTIGDPDAPPVLFLHGGGQSRHSWRNAARRVAEGGYLGITIDLRGHGDSDWAADGAYGLAVMASDISHAMATFNKPVSLAGASRGGQVALVAAAAAPDRTRLVLLADVAPHISRQGAAPIRTFMERSMRGFDSAEAAAQALDALPGRDRPADPATLARALRHDGDGKLYWRWDPRLALPGFVQAEEETALMERAAAIVRCPVLLVRAELSDVLTDEGVETFRHLTPHLQVTTAPGVGHMFTNDQNDAFTAPLLDLLGSGDGIR